MAENPAGTRQTDGKTRFGLEKLKEISQIIKDYFYLPFFLLIILCFIPSTTLVFVIFYSCSQSMKETKTDDRNTWSFVSVPDPEDPLLSGPRGSVIICTDPDHSIFFEASS
jgi:hypothetical protein